MTSYHIQINEEQRKLLERALKGEDVSQIEESQILVELLDEMPQIEKEHPRILHGLCL